MQFNVAVLRAEPPLPLLLLDPAPAPDPAQATNLKMSKNLINLIIH